MNKVSTIEATNEHTSVINSVRAEHVMIGTHDYEGTLAWYQEKLGFRTKHEWTVPEFPHLKLAYLEKNEFVLEIVASPNLETKDLPQDFVARLEQPGFGHLAFLVDDVDAITAALENQGAEVVVPPTSFPDSGRRLSFVEDNNGNMIEFLKELPLEERSPYTGGEKVDDKQLIHTLSNRWAEIWNIGTAKFDAEAFREVFAPGENAVEVFDNVQGDVITIGSVDEYIETWIPFVEPLPVWSTETELLTTHISGDLATTTFRIIGTDTKGPDGSDLPFGQYGTHVWKRIPELGWRIVHEHLTIFDTEKNQ